MESTPASCHPGSTPVSRHSEPPLATPWCLPAAHCPFLAAFQALPSSPGPPIPCSPVKVVQPPADIQGHGLAPAVPPQHPLPCFVDRLQPAVQVLPVHHLLLKSNSGRASLSNSCAAWLFQGLAKTAEQCRYPRHCAKPFSRPPPPSHKHVRFDMYISPRPPTGHPTHTTAPAPTPAPPTAP